MDRWVRGLLLMGLVVEGVQTVMATTLGIEGQFFTLNGKRTFLLGASYYAGLGASDKSIKSDLEDLKKFGFNWVRVWATWRVFGEDVSAVNEDGSAREPYLGHLKWLIREADRRGMVVDVTLSRGEVLKGQQVHLKAVETLTRALKPYHNVYFDLANERNVRDARFVSFEELRELRDRVKAIDPKRLVTASSGGDISRTELRDYLMVVQVDFIAPHRPREAESPHETEAKTREYLKWLRELGKLVPVHYQEPFRRGYMPKQWEPKAIDFLIDAKQAKLGGAAGWCFHNGGQRDVPEERPRRSFDMCEKEGRLFAQLDAEEKQVVEQVAKEIGGTGV